MTRTERRLVFRVHAIRRMFERGISVEQVGRVLDQGEAIEHYSDDTPYPSRLMLGWIGARPIHVIAAEVPGTEESIIVTVYEPNPDQWEPGYRIRKRP